MMKYRDTIALPLAILLLIALSIGPAAAQEAKPMTLLEGKAAETAKAIELLKQTSARLAAAKTMSFTAVNTFEVPAVNGQPLFYTTKNLVTLQRPDKLRVITPGDGVPDEFYYDGKTMTAYVPSADLAATAPAPPTIDGMLEAAWEKGAIYFPFDDVIAADPYGDVAKQVTSAFYVGQSHVIGGVTTDMVAIAGDSLQGELWIGAEDKLPRLIRVVFLDQPGQPHYETTFSDWKLDVPLTPDMFTSANAAKAKRMPFAVPDQGLPKNPGARELKP